MIVVVIPYVDAAQAAKAKHVHELRAGIQCRVITVQDKDGEGWATIHTRMSKELDYSYYVYSSSDYFPCRKYLHKAYSLLKKTGKHMLGFNDGKWEGENATAGMLERTFLQSNYRDGGLFYPGYTQYGADPDLTAVAKAKDEYVYDPSIVLMEIDYYKKGGSTTRESRRLYKSRMRKGFPA